MSPILSTTPTFMSPDLPIMPTSLMPTPTLQPATTPSVTVNHSQPHNSSALIYTIPAVSVVGLSIVLIFGWLYLRRRKTGDQEAGVGIDNDKINLWKPEQGIPSPIGKASDNISEKAGDTAFIIGDDDSDKDPETGNEDGKHTHHSEDSTGNTEFQDKDHPENPFSSPGDFTTSISSTSDSTNIRNDASLCSDEDHASNDSHDSHVTDMKRMSSVHWAAVKQSVADRTSIVQYSVRTVQHVHSPHASLEAQIVGHSESIKDPQALNMSTVKKEEADNNFSMHGMDSIFAEIDALSELYSSDGTSSTRSSTRSEDMPAIGSLDSAGTRRVDCQAPRHSGMVCFPFSPLVHG